MSEQNGSTLDDTMKSESNKSMTERATKAKATYEKSKKTAKKLKINKSARTINICYKYIWYYIINIIFDNWIYWIFCYSTWTCNG